MFTTVSTGRERVLGLLEQGLDLTRTDVPAHETARRMVLNGSRAASSGEVVDDDPSLTQEGLGERTPGRGRR